MGAFLNFIYIILYDQNKLTFFTNHTDKKHCLCKCIQACRFYLILCGSELVATENVLWFARKPNCLVMSRTPADFIQLEF